MIFLSVSALITRTVKESHAQQTDPLVQDQVALGPAPQLRRLQRLRHRDPGRADAALRPGALRGPAQGHAAPRRRHHLPPGRSPGRSGTGCMRIYEQMPEPKFVVAVGACAMSGCVYRGAYNIMGGIDQVIPVNAYIPGCPIRPTPSSTASSSCSESSRHRGTPCPTSRSSKASSGPSGTRPSSVTNPGPRRIFLKVAPADLVAVVALLKDRLDSAYLSTITGVDTGDVVRDPLPFPLRPSRPSTSGRRCRRATRPRAVHLLP